MQTLNYIPVKSVGRIQILPVEDIIWIKASANYVEIRTDERMMLHRDSICSLESKLDANRFIRVHRSAIINLDYVNEISSELGRYSIVCMRNGDEVRIGNSYRKLLFSNLGLDSSAS